MVIQTDILYAVTGIECHVHIGTGAHVVGFDADGGFASARFMVVVVGNLEQRIVLFKNNTFTKFIYIDHISAFIVNNLSILNFLAL